MDEYTRLASLNRIVAGWCTYYRYTSLLVDLEEMTRYTWFRYLPWLRAKHKGSRKHQLIQAKTTILHNRTRWTAQLAEDGKTVTAYQWLPIPKELPRTRYRMKGRGAFPTPTSTRTLPRPTTRRGKGDRTNRCSPPPSAPAAGRANPSASQN